MRFWTSVFLAAFILLLSTFVLGMSTLGVDIFSPTHNADKNIGVSKLVYYFNSDDQDEKQRKFIIAKEIGQNTATAAYKSKEGQDNTGIPINPNAADAFAAPDLSKDSEKQDVPKERDATDKEIKFTFKVKIQTTYTAQVLNDKNIIVRTFYKDFILDPGEKTIIWDRKDDKGIEVPKGKYTFKLTAMSPGIPVLIYHHLALGGKGYDENPYTETPANFLKQMDFLSDNNYNVISVQDLAEFMQGNRSLPAKAVAITFDDGYESVYKYAFPILKKRNFRATAFIIGKKAEGKQTNFVPNMSFEQLKEMYDSGIFDIQSHTYDLHDTVQVSPYGDFGQAITAKMFLKNLGRMETDEEFVNRITEDITKGKEVLEKNVGTKIVALAWPHGKNHEKPTQIAQSMGYKYFIEGSLGPNYLGDSATSIKRVFVKKNITDEAFSRLLSPKPKKVAIFTDTVDLE